MRSIYRPDDSKVQRGFLWDAGVDGKAWNLPSISTQSLAETMSTWLRRVVDTDALKYPGGA